MTAPDRFAEPAVFASGVRWEPSSYKPLPAETQERYIEFSERRGPNSE